jgi:hypothetical protein
LALQAVEAAVQLVGGQQVGDGDLFVEGLLGETEHDVLRDFRAGSDDNQTHLMYL